MSVLDRGFKIRGGVGAKTDKHCIEPGCTGTARTLGRCHNCYTKWHLAGRPVLAKAKSAPTPSVETLIVDPTPETVVSESVAMCSEPGCSYAVHENGMCTDHFLRQRFMPTL